MFYWQADCLLSPNIDTFLLQQSHKKTFVLLNLHTTLHDYHQILQMHQWVQIIYLLCDDVDFTG